MASILWGTLTQGSTETWFLFYTTPKWNIWKKNILMLTNSSPRCMLTSARPVNLHRGVASFYQREIIHVDTNTFTSYVDICAMWKGVLWHVIRLLLYNSPLGNSSSHCRFQIEINGLVLRNMLVYRLKVFPFYSLTHPGEIIQTVNEQ